MKKKRPITGLYWWSRTTKRSQKENLSESKKFLEPVFGSIHWLNIYQDTFFFLNQRGGVSRSSITHNSVFRNVDTQNRTNKSVSLPEKEKTNLRRTIAKIFGQDNETLRIWERNCLLYCCCSVRTRDIFFFFLKLSHAWRRHVYRKRWEVERVLLRTVVLMPRRSSNNTATLRQRKCQQNQARQRPAQ